MADKFIKIQFKADTDALRAGLDSADRDVKTFGDRIGEWGKKAAAAFALAAAAAGAYAAKLAVDSVKAAIADEAAQRKLATTLENVTGATNAQIKAVEDYISITALRTGIEDDQLRPAIARLIRSTEDATKAQSLLNLALDVAAGTGKPLETVVNALGKAYDGQTQSLGRLGLGIDAAVLKSGNFETITAALQVRFKGFAEQEANTFEGKIRRINLAFDEAKESLGAALLPVIEQFADYLIKTVIPAVQKWIDENGPKLVKVLTEFVIPAITATVTKLATITTWIADNAEILKSVGSILLAGLAAYKVTSTIATMVTALGTLATAYTAVGVAATGAGAATTAAAGTAAVGATSWAALAKNVNLVSAAVASAVGGFMLVKKGLEALVDAFKNWGETYIRNLLGLGSGGSSSGNKTPVYSSNPNLIGLKGYTPEMTTPTVPTLPVVPEVPKPKTAAEIQAELDRKQILGLQKDIAKTQSGITGVLEKLDAFAAQQLTERFPMYDRASTGAVINFNAPVVSDPESLARLIDDALTSSANRTGNYTNLGFSTTSLPAAAI